MVKKLYMKIVLLAVFITYISGARVIRRDITRSHNILCYEILWLWVIFRRITRAEGI